ncbi:hypothetical protein [Rhizobium etli]|uniref:Uncharacterized protein n=1 Tax=Rhizobium etli TaxID=29449 RepID=A0A7W6VC18_RHIET|nr:hypothetical protein [Rhizobium etli]MBB4481499.1 hypothetical protein [Rhizobium etli]MBB4537328.1 hypothetical protein [Rhizobium etli]
MGIQIFEQGIATGNIAVGAALLYPMQTIITAAPQQPVPRKVEDPPGWLTGPLVGFLAQCVDMIALNLDIVTAYYQKIIVSHSFVIFATTNILRPVRFVLNN